MEDSKSLRVMGRIDEELKKTTTNDGVRVTIHIAALVTDEKDGSRYKTIFYTVVASEELAAYALSHFEKGDPILVEGEPVYEPSAEGGGEKLDHILAHALLKPE